MSRRKLGQLSETDINILTALSVNPFAKDPEIGEVVNLDASTVQGRMKSLRTRGYVTKEQRLPDLAKAGVMLRYRIDMTINPRALKKSCNDGELKELASNETNPQKRLAYFIRDHIAQRCKGIIVEEVSILLGDPADLCATVLVPDNIAIFDFVTEQLRGLEEIQSTSTSHVSWRLSRDPEKELAQSKAVVV